MITKDQIQNLRAAQHRQQVAEPMYRIILHNVAGVASTKDLDNRSYEDMMAVMEDYGHRQMIDGQLCPPDYWRRKVARRGTFANGRLIHKIQELYKAHWEHAAEHARVASEDGNPIAVINAYRLEGLIENVTQGRSGSLEHLTPREANNLIEMLKAIIERATKPVETTENTEAAEADDMPF